MPLNVAIAISQWIVMWFVHASSQSDVDWIAKSGDQAINAVTDLFNHYFLGRCFRAGIDLQFISLFAQPVQRGVADVAGSKNADFFGHEMK